MSDLYAYVAMQVEAVLLKAIYQLFLPRFEICLDVPQHNVLDR